MPSLKPKEGAFCSVLKHTSLVLSTMAAGGVMAGVMFLACVSSTAAMNPDVSQVQLDPLSASTSTCFAPFVGKTFKGSVVNPHSWFVKMGFKDRDFAINEEISFTSESTATLKFGTSVALADGRAPPFECAGDSALSFSINCQVLNMSMHMPVHVRCLSMPFLLLLLLQNGEATGIHLDLSNCPTALRHDLLATTNGCENAYTHGHVHAQV